MRLYHISLNNIRRKKSKAIFLLISLVISVTTVVTLLTITLTMREDVDKKLDAYGANIIITPKADELALTYGGMAVSGATFNVKELHLADLENIKTIKNYDNISVIAPKLIGAVEGEGGQVLIVGINIEDELWLKKWWKIQGQAPEDNNQILLGQEVASKYNKKVGDILVLNNKEYLVSSILAETGDQEDSVVFMQLEEAQRVLNKKDAVSLVEVSARCNTCPIEEMTRQLGEVIPSAEVKAVKQTVQSKMNAISQFTTFSIIVSGIIVLISSLIIFITMLSSVAERTREIGIFRAIGYRRQHILKIILSESLIVSLVGGVIGFILSMGIAKVVLHQMAEIEVPMYFNIWLTLGAIGLAVVISLLSSLFPAYKASKLEPAAALRHL